MNIDQKKENIFKFFFIYPLLFQYFLLFLFLLIPSLLFSENKKEDLPLLTRYDIENLKEDLAPYWITYFVDEPSKTGDRLQRGVLFTHSNKLSLTVKMYYNNIRVSMKKGKNNIWYYIFFPTVGERELHLKYFFIVDSYHIHDIPNEMFFQDSLGTFISTWSTSKIDNFVYKTTVSMDKNSNLSKVTFRFFSNSAQKVYVISNFNNWMILDELKETNNGLFMLNKILPKGKYGYLFIVDGNQVLDTFNTQIRYHSLYEQVSYLDLYK